jgi:hypothetical protein
MMGWPALVALALAGAGMPPPGPSLSVGSPRQEALAEVAHRVRRAWEAQRPAEVVGQAIRVLVQLPDGSEQATVARDQAIRLLEGLFRRTEELDVSVRSSREVGPGQGYVELRRRFRPVGGEVAVQRVLLAFRREGELGFWRLVEVRVFEAGS